MFHAGFSSPRVYTYYYRLRGRTIEVRWNFDEARNVSIDSSLKFGWNILPTMIARNSCRLIR